MEAIKIQICSVEFSVNESKDTICKVIYKPNDVLSRSVFYGRAKLNPNDTYDKKMGQRIAFAKAERKAYKNARKNIKKDILSIKEVLDSAKEFYEKADRCFVHNDEYIKQLCGC